MATKFTKEQAIIISGFTGVLCCGFSDYHGDVEKRLKRGVWTHEFADPDVMAEIKAAYRDDFIAMCIKGEKNE